jgi:dTMP kinase
MEKIASLETWAQGDLQPDLTLLFDVPVDVGFSRVRQVSKPDKFESEKQEFFQRVREAYLERAKMFPQRIRIIDSTQSLAHIQEKLAQILLETCF